jgi:NarL family two-component system response regulator LiaR
MEKTIHSDSIRVMIVDDHEMVRRGLIDILNAYEDLEFVGQASDGAEALEKCGEFRPDIILMDLVMPGIGGVEATSRILHQYPDIGVIALTSFNDEQLVPAAMKAGAIGYLQKNLTMDELADAIRRTKAGWPTLSPEATRTLVAAATQTTHVGQNLTQRERQILALMVAGCSNAEIAAQLVVSLFTVKSHVSNIYSKLGVTKRTEAVALAIENGLISEKMD